MFFQDKVVWITGASSGIGEGVVYALAKQGAKLILSARRAEALDAVRNRCETDLARVAVLPLDLTDYDTLPAKAEQARALYDRIDILINNGGVGQRGYVLDTVMAVQQRIMQVNFLGQVALTKAVLPYMVEHHSGQVVVISSLSGKLPVPGRAAYCASKHALHGFFDALRGEVYQYGIKVTIICPGFVHTEIAENALLPDGSRRGAVDREHQKAMSADESARHILYAIRSGKEEYIYGGAEKWAVPARIWFPWLYSRAIRKVRLSM